jgi:hypothetical protein
MALPRALACERDPQGQPTDLSSWQLIVIRRHAYTLHNRHAKLTPLIMYSHNFFGKATPPHLTA